MQAWERGGLSVSDQSPTLGVPTLRMGEQPAFQARASVTHPPPASPPPVDLLPIFTQLSVLTAEVRALRAEVERRSLEGLFARAWAWLRRMLT